MKDDRKMGGRRLFSLFVLIIIVLAVGVPQVSAFTRKHTVQINDEFTIRELGIYPFPLKGYFWDRNYLQIIYAWQQSSDGYYAIKFKAIQCGNTTVAFKGVIHNNYYKITITC